MPRAIDLTTPLDKDVLLLHKMHGREELGRLFEYNYDLLSEDECVDLDEVLGKTITATVQRADDTLRYFNGYVTRISQVGRRGRYHLYQATVRPWFWFLTQTTDCHIFQAKTVPEILKEVFGRHAGIADVKFELTETYTPWEYCVQYRESDFEFASRLMEHEGIYYFFRHAEGRHTMVLADSYSAHEFDGAEEIPYIAPGKGVRADREHINEWQISREFRPGKYMLTDYDFERPSVDLQVKSNIKREHALATLEVYDYPGDYIQRSDGETYARTRIEELQSKYERVSAATNSRYLATGFLFKLIAHPRKDQNAEYLVVSTEHELQSSEYEALESPDTTAVPYKCRFTALNSQQPFRTERTTKKPMVRGPQTAVVVGPAGETIYTDKYGRVKLHFHWDRHDSRDENSSCWIRVSQNWGGKNWGGMFIPHVGQEVIVMFEEGDPDRPLVTGRVYNAEQMPPVELPGGKTKSIIRDHGANEIVMEGVSGSEQIRLFSPFAKSSISIGAPNSPPGICCDSKANHTVNVDEHWFVSVGGNAIEKIKGMFDKTVQGDVLDFFGGAMHRTIVGVTSVFIGGWKNEIIVGAETKLVKGAKAEFTNGAVIKSHKGKEYESNPAHLEKTGSLTEQVTGTIGQFASKWVADLKASWKMKAAGKAEMEAAAYQLKADKYEQANDFWSIRCKNVALEDCNKYKIQASVLEQDAGKIKTKADEDWGYGVLKVKGG